MLSPNGFANEITIHGVPLTQLHPGQVFWVGNNVTLLTGEKEATDRAAPRAGTFLAPFSTINFAKGQCAANRGDIILVRPGHTLTISAAMGINFDVAGVAIVGLGAGSLKPTITFETSTFADIGVEAANVSFSNIRFVSNIANLAAPLDVNDDYCSFDNCEFMAASATTGMSICILTNALGMCITNCTFNMESSILGVPVTDAGTEAIRLSGVDNALINDNFIVGDFSQSAIKAVSASEAIQINRNFIHNVNTNSVAGGIDLVAGCTGHTSMNMVGNYEATTIDTVIDNASCSTCFNHIINDITKVSDLGGTAST